MRIEQGRIFRDLRLPGVSAAERAALYVAAVETLAKLHSLDLASLNLEGYGKGTGYCKRQVSTTLSTHQIKIIIFWGKNAVRVVMLKSGFPSQKVSTWTKQYTAAAHRDIPAMNELSDWLMKNLPATDDEVTLVHGDFRLDNLIFHPREVQLPKQFFLPVCFK